MSSSSNRYRTIDTKIRGDARFRALSAPPPSARELWLHLIACGHDRSIPGLLVVGAGGLADDLEWEIGDVRRCFAEIETQGMAIADWTARVIWVPKAVAPGRNEPRSPDNVTAIGSREWGDVPECELKWRAYRAFVDYCATRGEKFLDAAIATFPAPEAERLYAESLRKVARPKGGAKGATMSEPKGRSRVAPSQQEGPTPLSLSLSPSPSLEGVLSKVEVGAPRPAEAAGSTPAPVESPVVARLPMKGGRQTQAVTEAHVARWREAYPGVDVQAEVARMLVWLDANPTKRPQSNGLSFAVRWLGGAQNDAARRASAQAQRGPDRTAAPRRNAQQDAVEAMVAWTLEARAVPPMPDDPDPPPQGALVLRPTSAGYARAAPVPHIDPVEMFLEGEWSMRPSEALAAVDPTEVSR